MGGVTLFIIISSLCIVILCIRRFHDKKQSHIFDNRIEIELNSDTKMTTNPSYSIAEQSRKQEDQYDNVLQDEISLKGDQDTIKMDSNPSYGRVQGYNACDVTEPEYDAAIQPNPSYSSTLKEPTEMVEDEDQDGYFETNSQSTQRAGYLKVIGSTTKKEESVYDNDTDNVGSVEINPNPSYDSVSGGVKLEDNPSYNKIILAQHP